MSAGGRPHSIRTGRGRSLTQTSIAKQIAEASKSPKLGRSGDRHSRCPQRRAAPLALSAESANLCELQLASACDCREPSWLGRAWATTARSTTDNTSTPTLRSEQTAVDRSGRCDRFSRGVPSACPRAAGPVLAPCLAPLPLGSGGPAARGSCCPPRPAFNGGEAARNAAGRIIVLRG